MPGSTRLPLLLLMLLVALAFVSGAACAQEQINSFQSRISIHADGSMDVTETISVVSQQYQIKHGIYRDFPTRYSDRYGRGYNVGFDVVSVTRDGQTEPYSLSSMLNGVRVYIGSPSVLVPEGSHTYVLHYTTNRQLGFFQDHDELYWNVTGNGWVFPIQTASAIVELPAGVPMDKVHLEGWTGPQGSTEQSLQSAPYGPGKVAFWTTRPLNSYEGLTIRASWPKGLVKEPSQATRLQWLLRDNKSIVICLFGLLVAFGFFIWAQARVGMDPDKGSIVPQWDAPDGLSPAAIRYISRMGSDNKAVSAAMINAAVKGYITIEESERVYTIHRRGTDKSVLTPEELAAIDGFLGARESIVIEQSNNEKFQTAIAAFKESLEAHYSTAYFATHGEYAAIGGLISLAFLVAAFLIGPLPATGADAMPTILFSLWSLVSAGLLTSAVFKWTGFGSRAAAIGVSLLGAVSIAAEIYAVRSIPILIVTPIVIGVFLFACLNMVFSQLLKSYTDRGRKLMDKAEGLRLYMQVAEQERLNFLNPPDRTPQVFERLLPYAIALDVEQAWSEQFADVLQRAQAQGYQPGWYMGPGYYDGGYSSFGSSFGSSLSSAISSASTPPGSSGGSGGSSGGGGGGGGGGGW